MQSLIKLGTDNTMVKRKTTQGQIMIYKTLHRKLSNMNLTKSGLIELIILH